MNPCYTSELLLDLHTRAHRSLDLVMEHCARLPADSLTREFPGFGYPHIRQQLHHVIGCEEYWISVLRGDFRVDEDDARYPAIADLQIYRRAVTEATRLYLRAASAEELNTPRAMRTYHDPARVLVPARVVMRVATHLYQHMGQILALCRLLGEPSPGGTDFPLD